MARPKSIAEKNALKGTIPTLTTFVDVALRAGPSVRESLRLARSRISDVRLDYLQWP